MKIAITGSSSGIGKAIALRFGEEGAKVVVTARRLTLCEQTVEQIKKHGGEAWAIQTDVSDERQVERLIDYLKRHPFRIIVGWSFFPLAPTDLICYLCGVLRVDFWKFLLGVVIGEGAICGIYIFTGSAILRAVF